MMNHKHIAKGKPRARIQNKDISNGNELKIVEE